MNSSGKNRANNHEAHLVKGGHAVVLGGSLAGLMTAQMLTDHFQRVTVVERDAYPTTVTTRRGVPQANHVHALLLRGRQILEQLFPGLQAEMILAGAPLLDVANDLAWFTPKGWGTRFTSDMKMLAFTRPLLDFYVRQRIALDSQITVLENTEVLSLVKDPHANRIAEVAVVKRTNGSGSVNATKLQPDLIVDTTGRASRAPLWLQELGYSAPEEIVINAHIGYASRFYKIPKGFDADWKGNFVQAAPPEQRRGGFVLTVEGDRWLVTLIGGGRDHPPYDDGGFLEFARSLPVSTIYDAIRNAEPLSPIKTHRGTENRLRRFDRIKNLPDNFVALGDSVCAFNPVYGQGMTIAAMGVMTLEKTLAQRGSRRDIGNGFSCRFQRKLAKVTKAPWLMATGEDFRYHEAEGGSATVMTSFMHKYMDQVVELATHTVAVRSTLLQVMSMLQPPSALFRPTIFLRVLAQVLGALTGIANATAARRDNFQVRAPASRNRRRLINEIASEVE
jgi:2-polyprenyl-6-methoxyphenol hydroxylase-like FAD-dependent oxidoreductase